MLVPNTFDGFIDGDDMTWYDLYTNQGMATSRCPSTGQGSEWQALDTAPRVFNGVLTLGDGQIGLDRSQLENYVAGPNAQNGAPKTLVGGDTVPKAPFCTGVATDESYSRPAPSDPDAIRALRIGSVAATSGSQVVIPIEADLAGGEVMTQFTIHFDPSMLSISDIAGANLNPDVLLGNNLPEGTRVVVNTTGIANGDLGIVVYFNGSGSYPAVTAEPGTKTLVHLRFQTTQEVKLGAVSVLNFNDNVFVTKTSDTLGQTLPVDGGLHGGAVVVTRDR